MMIDSGDHGMCRCIVCMILYCMYAIRYVMGSCIIAIFR